MQDKVSTSRLGRVRVATILALCAIVSMVVTAVPAGASGTVAKLVMTPRPIGTASTKSVGSIVNITVTAETSANLPVPGASIFLAFSQAIGGGTAFVGTAALGTKPRMFTADSSGSVIVVYSTPGVYPTVGVDVIRAQNGATAATSTVHLADPFCFSPITVLALVPKAIARKGTLGPDTSVPVTLTVFGQGGSRLANGWVWVMFKRTAGGGSASVGGVDLTSGSPKAFTTNSAGQVTIIYKTPGTLPATGNDRLVAGDSGVNACVTTSDAYAF